MIVKTIDNLMGLALDQILTLQKLLGHLQAAAALGARYFVAAVFFRSGLTKIADWSTTIDLFTYEYKVPLLPPEIAAMAGTFGELFFPVLLVLGLCGRFAALSLSMVNVMAVISLAEIAPAALEQHYLWGTLLVALVLWGPGAWSVDAWWWPRWLAHHGKRSA
jgi:putative oxidoreductase